MESLRVAPEFVSYIPPYDGKLKIPIGRLVIFPNISVDEYFDRGLQALIPLEMVLLKEDLMGDIATIPQFLGMDVIMGPRQVAEYRWKKLIIGSIWHWVEPC